MPVCQGMRFLLAFCLSHNDYWTFNTQLNIDWGSGNDKQTMDFVFVTETRHKSIPCYNGKILVTLKEMSKLYLCGYLMTNYSMVHGSTEKRSTPTHQEKKINLDY